MKGVHFYLEHETEGHKRRGKHTGNVLAVNTEVRSLNGNYEGLAGVYDYPNSPVATATINPDHLRRRCKRISEARAREIHPALFERLDADEG